MKSGGFSFVEVMMAILIVAFALGPIIVSYQQETRTVHYNEFHLLARNRARTVLETVAALDYAAIKSLVGKATYPAFGVKNIPTDLDGLPTLVAPVRYELPVIADDIELPPHLQHFRDKLELFQESLYWEERHSGDFGKLIAFITWKMPNEGPSEKPHVYRHVKFVARKELSMFARPILGSEKP